MGKHLLFLKLIFLLLPTLVVKGQTFNMTNGNAFTCAGNFYDSGGNSSNYSNNESLTYTLCSSANNCIKIVFTSFDVKSGDVLKVYNGPNAGYPLIGTYSGTTAPGPFTSTWSGCLTFVFISDGAGTGAGWDATITCLPCTPNQDCIYKKYICGTSTFNDNNNGAGTNPNELSATAAGCLGAPGTEVNSSWYSFSIATSGTLIFRITPVNGTDDYDFALWGPNFSCPPTKAPLRCSARCFGNIAWCGSSSAPSGVTGLDFAETDVSESPSTGNGLVKFINVLAGEEYILMVNNATPALNAGFTFSFGGTAGIAPCPTAVPINFISFSAEKKEKSIGLSWITMGADDGVYTIEKSLDGKNFYLLNEKVRGAGPDQGNHNYHIEDRLGDEFVGEKIYYKLWRSDQDEKKYLGNICVSTHPQESAVDQLELIREGDRIYLEVTIISAADQEIAIIGSDILGKEFVNQKLRFDKGSTKKRILISDFDPGSLLILFVKGNHIFERKKIMLK